MPPLLSTATRWDGHELATRHVVGPSTLGPRTVRRDLRHLDTQFARLFRSDRGDGAGEGDRPTPSPRLEWLLDNDFVVAEALETLEGALPGAFLRRLPGLTAPDEVRGRPRIESIARELVAREQGRLEAEEIRLFLEGYQEVRPLRIAELWALPSFLRIALLESLLAEASEPEASGEIGPYVLSLRVLDSEDWRGVVETLSRANQVLGEDPSGVFPRMDFRTRNRYRKVLEVVARATDTDEIEVAGCALELARARAANPREGHIGHYLIDEGRAELYRELTGKVPWLGTPSRRRRWVGACYPAGIAAFTALFLLALGFIPGPGWSSIPLLILGLIPGLGVAVTLVNWIAGQLTDPRALPRIDMRAGIPPPFRTLVAVPVLLGSPDEVEELLHTLETNRQANPDPGLSFALISDFPDADTERVEGDGRVLQAARTGIRRLNLRYAKAGEIGPFLLLHRGRRWNPAEGRWMGWERKRGKLQELNQLLLGRPSGLWVAEGDPERLRGVPFVITLDADTRMPRDAAARLVGTLAHPLNRPEIGAGGRILRGYSVLQPRIEILPDPDGGTPFSRIFGGVLGLDLYAHAAFDVYQDIFDVGIFAGKGIYDVEAFEASLGGRTPENSLLSHDLFEGAHGRAGLVADLVLLEDFPAHPVTHARRAHRWIRGDWQILPWLFPRVPGEEGERRRNRLSLLSRWMILDNLRRSLQPIAIVLLLLGGWLLLPRELLHWTLVWVGVVGMPFLIGTLDAGLRALRTPPGRADLEVESRALARALGRWGIELAFLPVEAWNCGDAVIRTLYRVFASRRMLLEWTSAAVTARAVSQSDSLGFLVRRMWMGPALGAAAGGAVLLVHGAAPLVVLWIPGLWLLSPILAHRASRTRPAFLEPPGVFPEARARTMARRIWGYYERFQGPESHWLAPDHFQEDPGREVAARTSPTNIGMGLVATVTAWDLGFLGTPRLITRLRNTVEGMRGLARYRGHFLNWYNTSTLEPLYPEYVSTVDSGNLAAAFLVTREALREAVMHPIWTGDQVEGIVETLQVIRELIEGMPADGGTQLLVADLTATGTRVEKALRSAWSEGLPAYLGALESLRDMELPRIESQFLSVHERGTGGESEEEWRDLIAWFEHLRGDVEQGIEEFTILCPWLAGRYRGDDSCRALHERLMGSARESFPSLETLAIELRRELGGSPPPPEVPATLRPELERALDTVRLLLDDATRLGSRLDDWFSQMDFTFLYDRRRDLFRIGFSVSSGELDANHYDLLASEARIASVVAMAKGDAPPAHWLHLGRPFTWTRKGPVLLSWAGTMFEYLMPTLFLRTPPDTVLLEACRRAIDAQREFSRKRRIPWGISESGYHVLSPEGHFQYHAFGVPALGLRRKAGTRLVVAPYASLMAIGLAPGAVDRNLDRLAGLKGIGAWGPYEALDFGPDGRWRDEPRIVRSYMSHHHGMILAALGNHLTGQRLVERFHRDPRIATVEPYLHERIPWRRSTERKWVDRTTPVRPVKGGPGIRSWHPAADALPTPVHHLVSGALVVEMGPDGRGGSRWGEWSIVRGGVGSGVPVGGPDLILRDLATGESWRPLPDPAAPEGTDQQVVFEAHRAEFVHRSRGLRVRTEVFLPPDAGVEVRQVTIANDSPKPRHLRAAVSAELALAPFLDDLRHPAFHKLFVSAEALPKREGVLFRRRARHPDESPPVLLVAILDGAGRTPRMRWGTSREAYLGREGARDHPAALDNPERLKSRARPHHPLDPMASAVIDVELEPWGEVDFSFLLAVGPDFESVVRSASELRSERRREWARIQARARVEGELLRIGARAEEPETWGELLSHILHPGGSAPGREEIFSSADFRQSTLWRWGISGDLPFILVEGEPEKGWEVMGELIRAQRWWRNRGVKVDLVVLSRGMGEYQDQVRERVRGFLGIAGSEDLVGRPGGVHIVRSDDAMAEDTARLRALAHFRVSAGGVSLAGQVAAARRVRAALPPRPALAASPPTRTPEPPEWPDRTHGLKAPSALGGFDPESGEYVIRLAPGETTPAPWVNVLARDGIGCLVTESGGSFTWAGDAGEFRLTPWHNDPVLGLRGEALYLRDEENGEVWTPAPGPLGRTRRHEVRHGWGRTTLSASTEDVDEEVTWCLHPELPVKIVRLRLHNRSDRPRRLSATFFADWVLGTHSRSTAGRLRVRLDAHRSVILARNPYILGFSDRIGFLATDRPVAGAAVDRDEFLGGRGPFDGVPLGLQRMLPGERTVPEGRPCAVLLRSVELEPGASAQLEFFLGAVESESELDRTLDALRQPPAADDGSAAWAELLGRVRVRTPMEGLDPLMNGWLPYQTIASRMKGRTGFYQSGGAFGFRDQLQDAYTLLPLDPAFAVTQVEEAARRQFRQGDVLHWWHAGSNRGVRTRCSDDLLWLPWVLAQTVHWTGDRALLDRSVPFLEADPLPEGVHERYDAFPESSESGTLWEHGLRAVERTAGLLSLRGLPLIGTGDWNDGMDRVGIEGRGESVWLGWFFLDVCRLLIPMARARGEADTARRLEGWSTRVHAAVESYGWDGDWYRRAYFDDGVPIGSRGSPEARIDSLAQSWSVISEAGEPSRARSGMEAAWRELVRAEDGVVLLLTPPFEGAGQSPGYIAAYPPGVRENGGQYTHAAAWLMRALAGMGEGDRAGELLRLILPTRHAEGEGTARYRVEPYVMAADVYGTDPYIGRGGWTWYTGSAGWVWRVVLEDVLGIRREGGHLRVFPCIPSSWDGFEVSIRMGETLVELQVRNPEGVSRGIRSCTVNGSDADPSAIPLPSRETVPGGDAAILRVEVVLG